MGRSLAGQGVVSIVIDIVIIVGSLPSLQSALDHPGLLLKHEARRPEGIHLRGPPLRRYC